MNPTAPSMGDSDVARGMVCGVQTPTQIPKALQNRAKFNPIVKTVKNCWILEPTPQDVLKKKAVKF